MASHPAAASHPATRRGSWASTKKLHGSTGTRRRGPRKPGGERDGGQQIIRLQILVVRQDLVACHAGAEQLQDRLNRVSQASNAGLAVADGRVNRDAR